MNTLNTNIDLNSKPQQDLILSKFEKSLFDILGDEQYKELYNELKQGNVAGKIVSGPNQQGWVLVRKPMSNNEYVSVLINIETGKVLDTGYKYSTLPTNEGWYEIGNDYQKLFGNIDTGENHGVPYKTIGTITESGRVPVATESFVGEPNYKAGFYNVKTKEAKLYPEFRRGYWLKNDGWSVVRTLYDTYMFFNLNTGEKKQIDLGGEIYSFDEDGWALMEKGFINCYSGEIIKINGKIFPKSHYTKEEKDRIIAQLKNNSI